MNLKVAILLSAFVIGACFAADPSLANCKGDGGLFFKINSYKVTGVIKANETLTVTANVTYYITTTVTSTKIVAYYSIFKVYDAVDEKPVAVEKGTTDLVYTFVLPPNLENGDYKVRSTFFDTKQLQCIELKFTATK